jgi:protein-tyrosine phosphatase
MSTAQILPELFLGPCPRGIEDIDQLKRAFAITAVLNLQTDEDMMEDRIVWPAHAAHYQAAGIEAVRMPIRDFDPDDLCAKLPAGVRALERLLASGHVMYLHCTAGQSRSPTVAIAYLHWCRGMELEEAVAHVRERRWCWPEVDAIREANWKERESGADPPA